MPPLPHYLYQYPQSKNFFFRYRIPRELTKKFGIAPITFVASLRTPNLEQARWFAVYVNARIKKDWKCLIDGELRDNVDMNSDQNEELTIESFTKSILSSNAGYSPKNWDFRAYLKERFSKYLSMAKIAIKTEREVEFDINKFDVKDSDAKRYEDHLKSTLENGESKTSFEQLAHPHYFMAYIHVKWSSNIGHEFVSFPISSF